MEIATWIHVILPKYLQDIPSPQIYSQLLKKLFFLENSYFYPNEISPEIERNVMILLTHNIPVYESTLTRIILMGITGAVQVQDVLEILIILIRRSATLDLVNYPNANIIKNSQLVEAILKLSYYNPPNLKDILQQYPQLDPMKRSIKVYFIIYNFLKLCF